MKFSPFRLSQKQPIEAVGSESIGYVYLLKMGDLTPSEDLGEEAQKQKEITLLYFSAINNLSIKENVSKARAREILMPGRLADGTEVEGANVYDYLERDDIARLLDLQANSKETQVKAATLMIRNRIAYPIVLAERAVSGSDSLTVEPLKYPLVAGDKIRYDDMIVGVEDSVEVESTTIPVKKLSKGIEKKKIGFLIDFLTGKEKIGCDDWDDDATRTLLTSAQVNAIFDFYMSEAGISQLTEDVEEGNSPTKSLSPEENPSSTQLEVSA